MVAKIIAKEKPDALLPTMGGQTALNCALKLEQMGVLKEHGVEMIGARAEAIEKAEDRKKFREAMDKIGLESPRSAIVASPELSNVDGKVVYDLKAGFIEAMKQMEIVGLPCIVRPAFTLGGLGGGVAYNRQEFEDIVTRGLQMSPVSQILIDESLLGWKEFEMEVVRDKADNCIIICSIENIDPMGVHTGDSITVAPALTLTDREYQVMRNASIAVLREIGVETGRLERSVRREPGQWPPGRHRDEPARVAFVGARLESHGLPDREDRRETGHRLHARRTRQRHHGRDAGLVRADDRLCRHQDPALRLREVQGRRLPDPADDADEVCRRGDGHRPYLPGIAAEGAALAGNRHFRLRRTGNPRRQRQQFADRIRLAPDREAPAECRPSVPRRPDGGRDPQRLEDRQMVPAPDRRDHRGRSAHQEGRPAERRGRVDAHQGDGLLRRAPRQADRRQGTRCSRGASQAGVRPVYKRIDTCAAEFAAKTPYLYSTYETGWIGANGETSRRRTRPSRARAARP
jgi:carbamoyl-phosphate synthase large subunit